MFIFSLMDHQLVYIVFYSHIDIFSRIQFQNQSRPFGIVESASQL